MPDSTGNRYPSESFFDFFGKNALGKKVTDFYAPGVTAFTDRQTKKQSRKNIEDYVNPGFIANTFKNDPIQGLKNLFVNPLSAPSDVLGSMFGRNEGPPAPDLEAAREFNKRNYWNMFLTKNANTSTLGTSKELSTVFSEGIPRLDDPKLAEQLRGRISTILTARAMPGRRQTILANPLQRI